MRMQKNLKTLCFTWLLTACAGAVSASPILINNASFENPSVTDGVFQQGAPTGWTIANNNTVAGVWNPNINGAGYPNIYYNSAPPDGAQVLALGYNMSSGEIAQDLGVALEANTTYTLTYWVGQRIDYAMSSYNVELLAGGTVLAADHQGNPSAGGWVQQTIIFNSDSMSGGDLSIDILGTGRNYASGLGGQADFDLIQLDASPSGSSTTPEPTSLLLLGSGLGLMAVLRSRIQSASPRK